MEQRDEKNNDDIVEKSGGDPIRKIKQLLLTGVTSEWRALINETGVFDACVEELHKRYSERINEDWYNNSEVVKLVMRPDSLSAVFNALRYTSPEMIHTIIIGQDPFPDPRYACGLAFSTPEISGVKSPNPEISGVPVPASTKNIYKAITRCGLRDDSVVQTGCLTHWAVQGILLLNTYLTRNTEYRMSGNTLYFMNNGESSDHYLHRFWQDFTVALVQRIIILHNTRLSGSNNKIRSSPVSSTDKIRLLLWGNEAKDAFYPNIRGDQSDIQTFCHPVARGATFLDCQHFKLPGLGSKIYWDYGRFDRFVTTFTTPNVWNVGPVTDEEGRVFTSLVHYYFYSRLLSSGRSGDVDFAEFNATGRADFKKYGAMSNPGDVFDRVKILVTGLRLFCGPGRSHNPEHTRSSPGNDPGSDLIYSMPRTLLIYAVSDRLFGAGVTPDIYKFDHRIYGSNLFGYALTIFLANI